MRPLKKSLPVIGKENKACSLLVVSLQEPRLCARQTQRRCDCKIEKLLSLVCVQLTAVYLHKRPRSKSKKTYFADFHHFPNIASTVINNILYAHVQS